MRWFELGICMIDAGVAGKDGVEVRTAMAAGRFIIVSRTGGIMAFKT